jgi:hypothetical protein
VRRAICASTARAETTPPPTGLRVMLKLDPDQRALRPISRLSI